MVLTACSKFRHWSNGFDSGVAIHVFGDLSLYGGIVRIMLDGQPRLIDLYGAASCGQLLFSSTGLANGQHSIDLELIGESPNVTFPGPARLFVFKNFLHVFFRLVSCRVLIEYIDGPHCLRIRCLCCHLLHYPSPGRRHHG